MSKFFSVGSVSLFNILGIICGFLINTYLAYKFGAGEKTDAYMIAFSIPSLFIYLVGFDSIKGITRTIFVDLLNKSNLEEVALAFQELFNMIIVVGLIAVVFAVYSSDVIVKIIAPGVSSNVSIEASMLCKIMLPSVLFAGMANVLAAILNVWERFFFTSLALFVQKSVILLWVILFCGSLGIYSAAWGMLLGALFSLLVLFVSFKKITNISFKFVLNFKSPTVKEFITLFKPLFFLLLLMQVNNVLIQFLGSFYFHGTITQLGYGKTVASLILPVLVTPILSVYLNDLTRYASSGEIDRLVLTIQKIVRAVMFLLAIVLIIQICNTGPIISILFQRGAFNGADVNKTALFYSFFILGIPFQVYGLINNYALLALKRTDLILFVGVCTAITNVSMSYLLSKLIGAQGIALGAAISWVVYAGVFHLQLRKAVGRPLLVGNSVWFFKLIVVVIVLSAIGIRFIFPFSDNLLIPLITKMSYLFVRMVILILFFCVTTYIFGMKEIAVYTPVLGKFKKKFGNVLKL